MWAYIVLGLGYGIIAAAQPGPFQTYIISQTLIRGWKKTIIAALAPLISDGPIIALCLFVLSQIPTWFLRFLYIAGGLFILYLAAGAYRSWRDFDWNIPSTETGTQQSILKAATMNILSPGPYIFWSTVTGPILLKGWRESPPNGIGLLAGFYSALILGLGAIIVIFGVASQLGPKFNRALRGISAILLLCFGFYQLWMGFFS